MRLLATVFQLSRSTQTLEILQGPLHLLSTQISVLAKACGGFIVVQSMPASEQQPTIYSDSSTFSTIQNMNGKLTSRPGLWGRENEVRFDILVPNSQSDMQVLELSTGIKAACGNAEIIGSYPVQQKK